ncbi:MAG: hypothetical protein Q4F71_01340 [Paracoccus sp. (in: a-proteobacteria)]|nr:hypothetical protein [Paracoccus sp. (in: a-proteobacteria)]
MHDSPPFPRADDGFGHAWGLAGAAPEALWRAFAARGWRVALEWAGSEDGEAIIARDQGGDIVLLYHLEDPAEAERLRAARESGRLDAFIKASLSETDEESNRSS